MSNNSKRYGKYINQHQESRWATIEEIQKSTAKIDLTCLPYSTAGIPLINDGKVAWVDDKDNHSLIFGSTGSKKTRLFVLPTINISINAGESFVVTDPKGEIYERTSSDAKEKGYDVVALNFRDFSKSDYWNPLELAYSYYKQGKINEAFASLNDLIHNITSPQRENTKDIFWIQGSESLLLGCALLLFETCEDHEINMSSLVNLCLDYGKTGDESYLNKIVQYMHPLSVAYQNISGVLFQDANKTRESLFSTLFTILRIFTMQKDLMKMMTHSSFAMHNIGRKKTAVYLIIPDEKETFHFLVSVFVKQCYETLIEEAQKYRDGKLPVRVNMILDEFANIPEIEAMGSMITAARSRNIRFYLIIQSMHQLTKRYKEDAETIKGNCANWIFLNSKELVLLKEISEMCGRTSDAQGNFRSLISVSELQRLDKDKGECLIFCQREYPFISEMADIDDCCWQKGKPAVWPNSSKARYSVVSPKELLGNLSEHINRKNEEELLFAREISF